MASALKKMAFYLNKSLRKKEGDSDFYDTEAAVKSHMKSVTILEYKWINPDTKEEITSKRYKNENYKFTNWMMCLDELIKGYS
jgi:hypothetical protein